MTVGRPEPVYTPLAHALVGNPSRSELAEVVWIALAHWRLPDGREQVCVEQLDAQLGDCATDKCFPREADARTYAETAFNIAQADWREGPIASR